MLALTPSPRSVPDVSVYEPDHHFLDQWFDVERLRPHFSASCSRCQ